MASEYKNEKINVARYNAQLTANEKKETAAIWKIGTLYKTGTISEAGSHEIIEYILIDYNFTP